MVNRWGRVNEALPAVVLVLVVLAEVVSGRGQVVLGLAAIAPLVAATWLGRRARGDAIRARPARP